MQCCLLLLLLLGVAMPISAGENGAQFQSQRIAKVEVKLAGTTQPSEQLDLLDLINIRAGEPYSATKIRAAILKLYSSRRAASVEVSAAESADGVHLIFAITRQLRVDRVLFTGKRIFAYGDLRSRVVGLSSGSRVVQPNVDKSADNLVKFYQDAGYFQASVKPTIKADASGARATIDFAIDPGPLADVESFELAGNLKLDRNRIMALFQTRPGSPFTQTKLQADLEQLRKAHIDEQYLDPRIGLPQIAYTGETNHVKIQVMVNSGPKVTLAVTGLELKPEKLQASLPMLQQGGVDDFTIEEGRQRLLEVAQREGYFFANINPVIEPKVSLPTDQDIKITYQVDTGNRYRVADIRLLGTDQFSYIDIADSLRSRRAGLGSRGLTSEELLTRDSETIEAKLRDLGYQNAAVLERRLGITPNNQNIVVTFVIQPGERVLVDQISFVGNQIFDEPVLRASLPARKLPYLSKSRLNEDTERLLNLYGDKGYSEAQITSNVEKIDETHAHVTFQIDEGDQVQIHRIIITNRGKARNGEISKYLIFHENDLLHPDDLSKSEQQLYATGAFRTVTIHSEYIGRSSDNQRALHDVFVDTVESQPYTLVYGGGYQSEDGPRGLFQVSNANVFGHLQAGTLTLRASRREDLGQISYLFPRPFRLPVNPLLVFFYRRREDINFSSRRFTGLLQIERRLNENSELLFRYTFEDVKTFNINLPAGTFLSRTDKPIKLGRVSVTYLRDDRDNIFDSTKGSFTTMDLSVASVALGSEREFIRFFANHQRYLQLKERSRLIFASNTQIGVSKTFDGRPKIPITERFFAGGANTLRGFGFEKAGPRDLNNQPVGGNALFVQNSELRFPVINRLGGVVFYDTGNVFRRASDFTLTNFSNTLGAGLRIATPIGPVRLDLGFLINPDTPERRVQFHFSFGQAF